MKVHDRGHELGTSYDAVVWLSDDAGPEAEAAARAALVEARALVRGHEARLSEWRDDSHICDVNRRAFAEEVALEPALKTILAGALHVAAVTDGAFDPTWRGLAETWQHAVITRKIPDEMTLARARAAVGWKHVTLTPAGGVRFGHRDTRLGIAGIAKGWIIDQAFQALLRAGFRDVLVNIGGDLRVGRKQTTFRIADPFDHRVDDRGEGEAGTAATFDLADGAVATSANHVRYWLVGDERVGHNLDPRTGRPPPFDGSVTVMTRDAAMADALATALYVMGPERGLAFAKKTPDLEVVYVTRRGIVRT